MNPFLELENSAKSQLETQPEPGKKNCQPETRSEPDTLKPEP